MDSRFSLEGRVAIVGGGSKGIGRAVANSLASAGASVTIAARTSSDLDSAASVVASHGGHVHTVAADLTNRDGVRQVVDETLAAFGSVDVLVNTVGGSEGPGFRRLPILDVDDESFDNCFRFNVKTALYSAQAVAPAMMRQGRGSIINVSTMMARPMVMPLANSVTYCMAKAAVGQMTLSMAMEWAPTIRVNCVAPGLTDTEGQAGRANDERRRAILERMAIQRVGHPDEVAAAVLFLASDASSWVTGATIDVNGGAGLVAAGRDMNAIG
jgi:NAD(P)-dependent dehydrogenase (short-subunit alcohol dehydrogenase family)